MMFSRKRKKVVVKNGIHPERVNQYKMDEFKKRAIDGKFMEVLNELKKSFELMVAK
jgi:hypothetical protein